MKDPVWGYWNFCPNELFSRGSHWEIRIQGEDSAIIVNRLRAGSKEKYQDDLAVVSEVVVPYLVNPSSGYPTDAPSDATDCFADLMTLSIQVSDLDGETIKFYAERLYERYYEGSNIPSQWIDQILAQMQSGHDFTESLRTVYQQLLRSEPVTPEEIVRTLYADLEG